MLEFLLKLIGLGFTSYFSSAWNWLDVAIIAVSKITSWPRLACVASVSVRLGAKNGEGESKWRKQKSGEGMEKKGSFLPSPPPPPPPLSFFGARFISRAAKAVNPVARSFFLY